MPEAVDCAGTDMSSEHFVLEEPSAIVAYYPDESLPAVPSVAVAGNSFVFIYRNMRPYFKFSLPALSIDEGGCCRRTRTAQLRP